MRFTKVPALHHALDASVMGVVRTDAVCQPHGVDDPVPMKVRGCGKDNKGGYTNIQQSSNLGTSQ